MADDREREIRERWAKATPGPWRVHQTQHLVENGWDTIADVVSPRWAYDARAIAAAPEDVAYLLGEVERLRERVRDLEWIAEAYLKLEKAPALRSREWCLLKDRLDEALICAGYK